jgi:hypothetical protein
MHTGKVLAFGGSGNDPAFFKEPHYAEVFDPASNRGPAVVEQELESDVFCAGHCFLPDGRLLVAGGTRKYDGNFPVAGLPPFRGAKESYLFDPKSERWTRAPDMGHGRWYPTLCQLADGRVVAVAGLAAYPPGWMLRAVEVFEPDLGWVPLRGASRWMPLYPRLHLLPDGQVFYSGSFNTHLIFPFFLGAFPTATLRTSPAGWKVIGRPLDAQREEGACVLLTLEPPKYHARVLMIGGGTRGGERTTNKVEMIDLSEAQPKWGYRRSMKYPRYYCYSSLLPDGKVLILGGHVGRHGMGKSPGVMPMPSVQRGAPRAIPHNPNAVMAAELYDPATDLWTELAPMTVERVYHSNAILLPDARVMMAGSNPMRTQNEKRIEIFEPPYLHSGPRPVIEKCPKQATYGGAFKIELDDAAAVDTVVLMRPSAQTHCLDPEVRRVVLHERERTPRSITVEAPPDPNIAPPGYYMVFALANGVPSKAPFVRVGQA